MRAQTIIARTDAAIAGYGQTVTFQRTAEDVATGAITVVESVTCPAAVKPSSPQDLQGDVVDILVFVTPTGLGSFGIPKRDDRILIDGDESNIITIAPRYYHDGTLCRVNLLCRG